jgi:hypothetical protein
LRVGSLAADSGAREGEGDAGLRNRTPVHVPLMDGDVDSPDKSIGHAGTSQSPASLRLKARLAIRRFGTPEGVP